MEEEGEDILDICSEDIVWTTDAMKKNLSAHIFDTLEGETNILDYDTLIKRCREIIMMELGRYRSSIEYKSSKV